MDRREAILARMLELAEGVAGVTTAKRNQLAIDDLALPAILIFDGDETAQDSDPGRRLPTTPRRVDMHPVITILVEATGATVGTTLNGFRAAYLKAMAQDETLVGFTHDRVGFRYEGSTPVVQEGRAVEGAMQLNVSFTYILKPAEL